MRRGVGTMSSQNSYEGPKTRVHLSTISHRAAALHSCHVLPPLTHRSPKSRINNQRLDAIRAGLPLLSKGFHFSADAQKMGRVLSGVLCSNARRSPDPEYPRGPLGANRAPYLISNFRALSRSAISGNKRDSDESGSSARLRVMTDMDSSDVRSAT